MRTLYHGTIIGRYTILGEIGRGGMAVVYKARQEDLGRIVALKIFNIPNEDVDNEALNRFNDEARHLARLSHSNIVQIYETGTDAGVRYIAMEYIDGPTLADCIATERIDPQKTLTIVAAIARALQYAHENGVLHRDITPGNIKLRQNNTVPVIMDFGLSKEIVGNDNASHENLLIGTTAYMSPEQADGRSIDTRSDIFSLGIILYELLTHNNPFRSPEGFKQTVVHILTKDPKRIRRVMPWIERDIETITHKALEKECESRYQYAGDFADDIARYLNGDPIKARPAPLLFKWYRSIRKHKMQAVVGLGLFLLFIGAFIGYVQMASYKAHQLSTIRIVHVQGAVNVYPASGSNYRASIGMVLNGTHTVRTGAGASMTVMIGNTIKIIDENTRIEFSFNTVQGHKEIAIKTLFGSLLSQFDGNDLQVRTIKILTPEFNTRPQQSSAFNVHVEETGKSEIQVFRGTIQVETQNGDSIINISQGTKISSAQSGSLVQVRALTQKDIETVRENVSPALFSTLLGGDKGTHTRLNHNPKISSLPSLSLAAGGALHYQVKASDPDGDQVLYRLENAPKQMKIEAFSGVLMWRNALPGPIVVTIVVEDPYGGLDQQELNISVVHNNPPIIHVRTAVIPGTGRMHFLFDATDTEDEESEQVRFRWDFNGDGTWEYAGNSTSAIDPIVEYHFSREGRHTIIVEATDSYMNRSVKKIPLLVGKACFADAGHDTTVAIGSSVCYNGEGFSRIGSIIKYTWDFDNDGVVDKILHSSRTVTLRYTIPGEYRSALTVFDDSGEQDSDTITIIVYNAPIRAMVANPTLHVVVGAPVALEGSGVDPDGTVVGYTWDFDGDGSVDWKSQRTGNVKTRYRTPGKYLAQLTVTAADGTQASAIIIVNVIDK